LPASVMRAEQRRARWSVRLSPWLAIAQCLAILAACGPQKARVKPLDVVATIAPLADWAAIVGGDRVQVRTIVPPGVNPQTYQPSVVQQRALRNADVVLLNGLSLEPWIDDILDAATNSRLVVLEVAQFTGPLIKRRVPPTIRPLDQPAQPPDERPDTTVQDRPLHVYSRYLWLDPVSAIEQVRLITTTLIRVDPAGIVAYRQNAARYQGELENLDSSLARQIDAWHWRAVLATDRFLYPLASHYDMPDFAIGDPMRQRLVLSQQPVLRDKFAQRGLPVGMAGHPVAIIDPLPRQSYTDLMRTVVTTMATVMAGT
jgi:ABC-type Zn uptake system ZnuABC Zn-binding protein ZnuA